MIVISLEFIEVFTMLFFVRHLRTFSVRSGRNLKVNSAHLPSLRNLKFSSKVDPKKCNPTAKNEFSLSNGSMKKFVKYVELEIAKGRSSDSEIISEHSFDEVSTLLQNRSNVEESMKSLEDLGNYSSFPSH